MDGRGDLVAMVKGKRRTDLLGAATVERTAYPAPKASPVRC